MIRLIEPTVKGLKSKSAVRGRKLLLDQLSAWERYEAHDLQVSLGLREGRGVLQRANQDTENAFRGTIDNYCVKSLSAKYLCEYLGPAPVQGRRL